MIDGSDEAGLSAITGVTLRGVTQLNVNVFDSQVHATLQIKR